MPTRKSPPGYYTTPKTGRPLQYPCFIAAQVTEEQKEFIDNECRKLSMNRSEYIRTIIQDLIDFGA